MKMIFRSREAQKTC